MNQIVLRLIMAMVNSDVIVSIVKIALNALKAAVKSSSTDWDDKILLPIIEKVQKTMGV